MKFPAIPVLVVVVFVVGFLTGRLSVPEASVAQPVAAAPAAPVRPSAPPAAPAPSAGGLVGVVAELAQVPNYTYLKLSTAEGELWAAVPSTSNVTVGQRVTVLESTRMTDFPSKTLNRTFATIVFGELAGEAPAPTGGPGLPAGHPPVGNAPPPSSPQDTVARALEATRQAEPALSLRVVDVFSERQSLVGRLVRVKGTVTKVTSVSGTTYAHVVDGSGSTASKDDDLLVILQSPVAPQAQVTVTGRVSLNKDVGIGASWPVALEGATAQ